MRMSAKISQSYKYNFICGVFRGIFLYLCVMNDFYLSKRSWWVFATAFVAVAAVAFVAIIRYDGSAPDISEYTVRGVDVSAHNGIVNFDSVKSAGYDFVIAKATEGASFKDSRFAFNMAQARKAGLKVGAYHFYRFDVSPYLQGLNIVHSLRGQKLDLPVAIDVEQWSNPSGHTALSVLDGVNELVRYLRSRGFRVMVYTNKRGFERYLQGRKVDYPLWLCSLSDLEDKSQCRLWQYSHSGKVKGVAGAIDQNVFTGSRQEWNQWLSANMQ